MKKVAIILFLWLFSLIVIGQVKNSPVLKITGSIGTRSYFSAGSKSPIYQANPFGYSLYGNVNIQLTKHLSLPFSMAYSNRKTTFSQPFNQFGMSPTFKGITIHAGYRSLRFSDYTLNGFNILGGGFEVQKGILRSGFMMGRFARATASAEGTPTSYLRWGYAAKLGIGKKDNFFDLLFLNAEDITSSIPNANAYRLNPAKNMVIGVVINQRFKLSKRSSLVFRTDGAMSIYTGNILAQNLDTTNFENIPPVLYKTVSPNISSRGVFAFNSSLAYSHRSNGLRLGYNRVDPGYGSMGIYTTNNDIEIISIAPRFSLLKNKVSFSGNMRLQRDNLLGDKTKSTRRMLPNANLNINPSRNFGISTSVNYSTVNQTLGIKQTNPVPISQFMHQANYSINISPRLAFGAKSLGQSLNMNIGTNKVLDKGEDLERKKYSEFSGLNATLNYGLNIEAFNGSANLGGNYFSLSNYDATLDGLITKNNYGINAGFSKPFLAKKLNANLSVAYTISQENDKANNLNISANYKPAKHHIVRFGLSQAQSRYKNNETRNFTEFRGTLDYTYNF
jgi:hypothetical protein